MTNPSPARRGGRPSLKRVAAINDAILAAARSTFLEDGFHQTTMESVALAAGVSKGTLYARFPDKTALFGAVVAERVKAWAPEPSIAGASGQSLRESLIAFAEFALEQMAGPEIWSFNHFVMAEARRFPEIARIFHDTGLLQGLEVLTAIITSAAARDRVTVRDPAAVGIVFIEMLWGWSAFQALRGLKSDAATRRTSAERHVAILISGLAAW